MEEKAAESKFLALVPDAGAQAVMEANLGNSPFGPNDMIRLKMPAAGATTWSVPTVEGIASMPSIKAIIAVASDCRGYWPDAYSGATPPQCSSVDGLVGVGDPGGQCDQCPLSKWNRDRTLPVAEQKPKCKQMKRLFLFVEGRRIPMMLTLSPTSLRSCREYLVALLDSNIPCYGVVTEIGLEQEKNAAGIAYSAATFRMDSRLSPEQTERAGVLAKSLRGLSRSSVTTEDYNTEQTAKDVEL